MLELNSNYLSFRLSNLMLIQKFDLEHLLVFVRIAAVGTQSEAFT